MRALPRSTRVLGQVIPVTSVPGLTHGDEQCHGLYSPEGPSIRINRDDGNERRRSTLMHESLHAMFNAAALSACPADNEEEMVTRLAPILLSWLRENRLVVEYLKETAT